LIHAALLSTLRASSLSALMVIASLSVVSSAHAQTPLPNPPLEAACGLDIVLVIDGSGSLDATEYAQIRPPCRFRRSRR
jgi:hypothetical protein